VHFKVGTHSSSVWLVRKIQRERIMDTPQLTKEEAAAIEALMFCEMSDRLTEMFEDMGVDFWTVYNKIKTLAGKQ
jgi:hypothetical protein